MFDGAIARAPSLKSPSKSAPTTPKPPIYGTGGTAPAVPKTPIKPPAGGYNRPVLPRVTNILTEVYGKARPVAPSTPVAGTGGAAVTGGLATATGIGGSFLAALVILNGDNNPGKVLDWMKGVPGIDKAEDQLASASTAFGFIGWDANTIASVLKKLTPQQSSHLIAEATRLGAGIREGERFGPKDIADGMTAVLKSIGLDAKGESLIKKPKFTPPKQPLDQIRIGRGKDKKTGFVPAKPKQKPLQIVPKVAALPQVQTYKPVPIVPSLPQVATPSTASPKGGVKHALFVEDLELERLVKQDGTERRVKKRKIDGGKKQPMRVSASDGKQPNPEAQNQGADTQGKTRSRKTITIIKGLPAPVKTYVGRRETLSEICKRTGLSEFHIRNEMKKGGSPIDAANHIMRIKFGAWAGVKNGARSKNNANTTPQEVERVTRNIRSASTEDVMKWYDNLTWDEKNNLPNEIYDEHNKHYYQYRIHRQAKLIYEMNLKEATLNFRSNWGVEKENLKPEIQQAYYDRIHLKRIKYSNIPAPSRWWESDYTIQNEFIQPSPGETRSDFSLVK